MSNQLFGFSKLVRYLINRLYKYPVRTALCICIALMISCSWIIAIESSIPFYDALFKVLLLFLGEVDNIEWKSRIAKLAGVGGLLAGVGFIAIAGGRIVTWFVNFSLRGGRIVKKVNYKNHIIICGWNIQGKNIIKQLLSPDIAESRSIVVLANLQKRPLEDDRIDFISGDPTKEEDLKRAGIMTADTAIVLTEMGQESQRDINPDAQAVLITLAIETLRPDVYTCVQLFNSEYKKHLERANVDEYICLDRLSGNLLVASALNHGLSWVLGELLEFSSGSEFYKKSIPKEFAGMRFREVAKVLHDERLILVAVETKIIVPWLDEEGNEIFDKEGKPRMKVKEKWIINPQESDYPEDYILKLDDKIFIIAVEEPTDREMNKIVEKVKFM